MGFEVRVGVLKLEQGGGQAPLQGHGKPGGVCREYLTIGSLGDSTPKGQERILAHTVCS